VSDRLRHEDEKQFDDFGLQDLKLLKMRNNEKIKKNALGLSLQSKGIQGQKKKQKIVNKREKAMELIEELDDQQYVERLSENLMKWESL